MITNLLLAAALTVGGSEFWHGTRYGMTLRQVLATVPEAHRVVPPIEKPIGVERALAEHLEMSDHSFQAEFWFHGNILDEVQLVFDPLQIRDRDGDWIRTALAQKYGVAQCPIPTSNSFCHWERGGTHIGLIVSEKSTADELPVMIVSFDKADKKSEL